MTIKPGKQWTKLERKIRRQFLGQTSSVESQVPDLRVVLYSHDTMGVGHMRRNLLIACKIKEQFPNASILTIAGAKEASIFSQLLESIALRCIFSEAPGWHIYIKKPRHTG